MKLSLEITPSQQGEVLRLCRQFIPNAGVWAFGSRVVGTARANSDLDIVVLNSAEKIRQVNELREALDESSLPFRVDLHVWDDLPPDFQENIQKQHVVLHGGAIDGNCPPGPSHAG